MKNICERPLLKSTSFPKDKEDVTRILVITDYLYGSGLRNYDHVSSYSNERVFVLQNKNAYTTRVAYFFRHYVSGLTKSLLKKIVNSNINNTSKILCKYNKCFNRNILSNRYKIEYCLKISKLPEFFNTGKMCQYIQ